MRQGNIVLANWTRDQIMEYFIDKVDEDQEGVQFHWQGRVLITIEPTNENLFDDGERFFDELKAHYNLRSCE